MNNKDLKWIREYLYYFQYEYEQEKDYNEQTININQRIRALLDIYEQMLNERVFEDEYLKDYLR